MTDRTWHQQRTFWSLQIPESPVDVGHVVARTCEVLADALADRALKADWPTAKVETHLEDDRDFVVSVGVYAEPHGEVEHGIRIDAGPGTPTGSDGIHYLGDDPTTWPDDTVYRRTVTTWREASS